MQQIQQQKKLQQSSNWRKARDSMTLGGQEKEVHGENAPAETG
jgi:hypothetical protein